MKQSMKEPLVRMLATGFGIGRMPLVPGTWGSLEATVVVGLVALWGGEHTFTILLFLTLLWFPVALLSASIFSRAVNDPDPSCVVADEIVGQFICLLFVPVTKWSLLVGFLLFRLFDIWKPFPARQCEQLPRGWGILMDDVVAGIYSGVVLMLVFNYAG